MTIKLQGVIIPTTPLQAANALRPDARFDYTTGHPTFGSEGMPMTSAMTKGILLPGDDTVDHVPYYPANGLRGRLRRHAADHIFAEISARDEHVKLDTHDGMRAGNFRGRPDNTPTTLTELRELAPHFFMGTFGGGPRTLPSKLITHDLDPIYPRTIELGTVPARFQERAWLGDVRNMIGYFGCIRRDDTTLVANLSSLDCVADALNALNDRQDDLAKARNKRKGAKKAQLAGETVADASDLKKDDLANMFAYQVMRAGVPLYLEIGFSSDPTPAQVGLILEALVSLFNENALGGSIGKGCGRFHGHANLVVDGQDLGPVLQLAQATSWSVDPGYVLTDLADEYTEAKDEALLLTTAADLDRFFVYKEPAGPLSPTEEAA